MKIAVITSAPELVQSYLDNTILKQAIVNKTVLFHIIDIRDFAIGGYRQIDDTPFGGGSGMVMMAEPLMRAIKSAFTTLDSSIDDTKVIYPTPQGKVGFLQFLPCQILQYIQSRRKLHFHFP